MSAFTEFRTAAGEDEVYASTNRFMAFAIQKMDAHFTRFIGSHEGIAYSLDRVPPVELRGLRYLPVIKMMQDWVALLFAQSSRTGLIPTEASGSLKRAYNPEVGEWLHETVGLTDNYIGPYGVVSSKDVSVIKTLARMHDFLSWFPPDYIVNRATGRTLVDHCRQWADAFKQANHAANANGHLAQRGGWALYDHVHAGPAATAPPDTSDFETQFRFSLGDLPMAFGSIPSITVLSRWRSLT